MPMRSTRALSIAFGALATTMLSGCYYGDVHGASYAARGDCAARYGDAYYDYGGYAYDDGYGYDCYDAADYGSGFVQIGFGGGWYDNYYYPGYGLWMFDRYRNRYPLRDHYLNYWGGRRAWWKYHGKRGDGKVGRPGWHRDRDGDDDRGRGKGRPGWNRDAHDDDRPRGARPRRPAEGMTGTPRAIRNLPATEPGEIYSRPRGRGETRATQRSRQQWPESGAAPSGTAPVLKSAPPVARPAVRSAPPPRASTPAAPPPRARANRVDRPNKVRDQ